jgi:hypothetical protein
VRRSAVPDPADLADLADLADPGRGRAGRLRAAARST